MAITLKHKGAK